MKEKRKLRETKGDAEEKKRKKKDETAADMSSDDDDASLLAAACEWATVARGEEEGNRQERSETVEDRKTENGKRSSWSLHVTQLSFDVTEYDLRTLFVDHGCFVSSVRLVYDTDPYSKHRTFRGVAFVDVSDEDSSLKALKLDRAALKGRKINVRPTRTKTELAEIVKQTRERVASKIEQSKDKAKNSERIGDPTNRRNEKGKRPSNRPERRDHEREARQHHGGSRGRNDSIELKSGRSLPDGTSSTAEASTSYQKAHRPRKIGSDRKLTKKERNRRAAIIASRRRK